MRPINHPSDGGKSLETQSCANTERAAKNYAVQILSGRHRSKRIGSAHTRRSGQWVDDLDIAVRGERHVDSHEVDEDAGGDQDSHVKAILKRGGRRLVSECEPIDYGRHVVQQEVRRGRRALSFASFWQEFVEPVEEGLRYPDTAPLGHSRAARALSAARRRPVARTRARNASGSSPRSVTMFAPTVAAR